MTPSHSPWRIPQAGRPESIQLGSKLEPPASSWWAKFAAPETRYEDFTTAAEQRDALMRVTSPSWRVVKMGGLHE